jgi:glyoxylase-like metal-dependent hydrolase (beta-lactamase superfamily II)/rhodanese-related sulfurtransferase
MFFKQFYLGCLAHASYLIGSEGSAVVVDPQRDVDQYLSLAAAENLTIRFIIETHLHADFVSGHIELAERTGAEIVFGARAGAAFPHRSVKDGDEIVIGKVVLRIMETPGHTPESISVLITDTELSSKPQKVLTGDALFIGDVGRPDLVGSRGYSAEQMAGLLYDSLHLKLLKLDDDVEVYPAHGAGSLCGRNISSETTSTIGQQRRFNYALQPMPRAEFIRMMTADLPPAPAYFSHSAAANLAGAPALEDVPKVSGLRPADVQNLAQAGALLLDVRPSAAFASGHAAGSLNIGLGGQFASWAGTLIPLEKPLVIIADQLSEVEEAVLRLARVGIETVRGFLAEGVQGWDKAGFTVNRLPQIPVDELRHRIHENPDLKVIDVRAANEYKAGHIPGAVNIPLPVVEQAVSSLSVTNPIAVVCAGGYRSVIAASILARHGFRDVVNVVGGTSAWISAGYGGESVVTEK